MPSPHPVGLQSCCSTPQGSLPLRLYWITPPHWNNALPQPGSLPLRLCQALAPPGPPPLGTCQIHALLGPQSLGPCQIHTPSGLPPLKSPPLRLCWTQLHMGQPDPHPTWIHASWASRPGTSLAWDNCIPQPSGIPAPGAEPGPSSTGSPDKHSNKLLLRLPLQGSKHA
jgi:hypothetical protein